MNLYEIEVQKQDGSSTTLEPYKGQVLLVVNTATGCGLTPQYEGLQKLYDTYRDQGFEILDFPCNQFGNQAPGSDDEINDFCDLNYQTSFPRFAKVDVNGDDTSPLYRYLKNEKGGFLLDAIKWNFTKFLVDRNGKVVKRFSPTDVPEDLAKDIEKLLLAK